jgi:hypothetical protein
LFVLNFSKKFFSVALHDKGTEPQRQFDYSPSQPVDTCRGAEEQRCGGAEVRRSRGAEEQRCGGAEERRGMYNEHQPIVGDFECSKSDYL